MKRVSTRLAIGAALALGAGVFTSTSFAEDAPKKPETAPAAASEKKGPEAKPEGLHGAGREGRRGGEGMRGGMGRQAIFEFWNDEKASEKLALTAEQKEKLKAAYAEAKPKIEAATKKREEMRAKLSGGEMGAPPKLDDETSKLLKEASEARAKFQEKVEATLTEEQRKTYREIARERFSAARDSRRGQEGEKALKAVGAKKDDVKANGAVSDAEKEKVKEEKAATK